MALIVQKYGGATLSDPQKIKAVARRVAEQYRKGDKLVVAVSAMGQTTNSLIDLALQISSNPHRREMDMLLTTGERVSMALVSMALNDLGCSAISLTGSQAGILTDSSHSNAFIKDVKAFRVQEALDKNQIVVLAGFQGVSPESKEITTLGRGGTDTTAVAMAAFLKADRCEILKDVPSVLTADPRIVPHAKSIPQLSYQQMMEMTFWGAKVLHYRSVELAQTTKVKLYVGPAHSNVNQGTLIQENSSMYESIQILSLNSHEQVLHVSFSGEGAQALMNFEKFLTAKQIAFPQILECDMGSAGHGQIWFTGPKEMMVAIERELSRNQDFKLLSSNLSTVTATCTGVGSPEISQKILNQLNKHGIKPHKLMMNSMSTTVILAQDRRAEALTALHSLINLN